MTETEVLANIRRAYRYVVAYERRVLDAVDIVDEVLRGSGFDRANPHRTPLYNSFPTKGYAPQHWTWDNVPNYACRYQWNTGEPNAAGNRWVLVDHIADTAFERRQLAVGGEPDPLSDLEPVEAARSILRWHAITFSDALPPPLYRRSWNNLLAEHYGVPATQLMFSEPLVEPHPRVVAPLALTTHCIDLGELKDGSALRTLFVEPLVTCLKERSA